LILFSIVCLCFGIQKPAVAFQSDVASWYPRTVTSDKGTVVIYAPQIESWRDFDTLSALVAFRITRAGSEETFYGSVRLDAKTDTDLVEREVLLHDAVIHELAIGGLDEQADEYRLIAEALTARSRTVPLDLVLEYLPEDMEVPSAEGLNTNPPDIFIATEPAILLRVDTEPMFVPVQKGSDLRFVINTNWDVLQLGEQGALYLCYEDSWLTADEMAGGWAWAETLPRQFGEIPDESNWTNVRNCLPPDLAALPVPAGSPPQVFYSTGEAELLLLDGAPAWEPIADSGVEFAANTRQELFRVGPKVYVLLSGRWFQSDELSGQWTKAKELPEAFREIPPAGSDRAHSKSYVRTSIPGTREAWEAALVASIPHKAEIVKGTESALNLDVKYAGEPAFTKIESTDIEMAVNTSFQVFRHEGVYYVCHNATWLKGFNAMGPWQFADSIPDQFAAIPPSSPAYNTTFVKVGDSDEETISYEYTSGYEGAYVSDSTVVYGTGYPSSAVTLTIAYGIYDGWWGYPHYPYYPWPPTYGYGSWYDPETGRYGESVIGYGPYGAAAGTAVYNPETGAYARGQAVWDSDEYAGRGYAYNPNTNTSIARNRYVDFEDNEGWSESVARRGDEWLYSESRWEDGRMVTEFESSRGTEGTINRERQGDAIVSEGTITGENRSATIDSVIEDGQYAGQLQGSEGASGTINRELQDGEISGGSTFTKNERTIETDVTRTAEGVQREFETSGGGQGVSMRSGEDSAFAYESASGDVYAGKDGNVYQRTDDGWAPVENPSAQRATRSTSSSYSQLDRDFQSRQRGFDRYARHQSRTDGGGRGTGRNTRGRRR
jgi:hypothetical protein